MDSREEEVRHSSIENLSVISTNNACRALSEMLSQSHRLVFLLPAHDDRFNGFLIDPIGL